MLLFIDSMDNYPTGSINWDANAKWSVGGNPVMIDMTWTPNAGTGRFGGMGLTRPGRTNQGAGSFIGITNSMNLAPGVENYLGMWFKCRAATTSQMQILGVAAGSTIAAGSYTLLSTGVNRNLFVHRLGASGNNPPIAISQRDLCDNRWHWIEARLRLSETATGAVTIRVDGETWFDLNNVQTMASGLAMTNQWRITGGSFFVAPPNVAVVIDDVICWDNTGSDFNTFPIGPQRMTALNVSGAGDEQEWTASSGNNATIVAGRYYGQTAYVQDNAVAGTTDLYQTTDPTTDLLNIRALGFNVQALAPDVARNLTPVLKRGTQAAENQSAIAIPQGSAYTVYRSFSTAHTNGQWTGADLQNLQIGMTSG